MHHFTYRCKIRPELLRTQREFVRVLDNCLQKHSALLYREIPSILYVTDVILT